MNTTSPCLVHPTEETTSFGAGFLKLLGIASQNKGISNDGREEIKSIFVPVFNVILSLVRDQLKRAYKHRHSVNVRNN